MKKISGQIGSRIVGLILLALLLILVDYIPTREPQSGTINRAGNMKVHFIDVGQGDAILVEADNSAMLIDAGDTNKRSVINDYLDSQNIKKLDYVIATHPHIDHIGGLDTVLNSYEVEKIILPDVLHTTKACENLLDTIKERNLSAIKAKVGSLYYLGSASFTILAPNSDYYEDVNNYSIVIRLCYGDSVFLFTGDAEKLSEEEMLASGRDLSADVIKLAHHGSANSSGEEFLEAVNPAYAVISVADNNDYGHPHKRTLNRIHRQNIKLYRTDKQGTIVFHTNGTTISVNKQNYKITKSDLE
jgi:competence protein ComEC